MNGENVPHDKDRDAAQSFPTGISDPSSSTAPQPQQTAKQFHNAGREMNGFERATIRLARLAFGASLVAAIFIALQWYEMHTGSTDTHALAEAASKQAEEAEQSIKLAARTLGVLEIQQRAWIALAAPPNPA